ncbi:hypothetical protein EV361DRAFT_654110 [Lentinula raphanica]|nr:hypothetical protein F5880DRAFT_395424 [Lentinula raphanica]KAJ3974344.1 hypothetical protein EV361DRAFT_654110 [Lentinula raphanica]
MSESITYDTRQLNGVISISVTGLVSLIAIVTLLLFKPLRPSTYTGTHLFGYLSSLLLSNAILASSTAMSFNWIVEGGVSPGTFCTIQAALKQAGNISTALWSFLISVHLFNLLFLRFRSSFPALIFCLTLFLGWGSVAGLVIIGPMLIQSPQNGPYFGVVRADCGITDGYPDEQVFLEYFLQLLSSTLSFILFTFILLRVRGNLLITNGRWTLQHVRRCDSWQLVFTRDLIDTAMLRFAQTMVWFPIAYTILLLPSGIARFSALSNHPLSLPVEIFTAVTYNLTGLVNVLLLLTTHNLFPHNTPLPAFNTQRNAEQGTMQVQLIESGGVTPFTLTRSLTAESYHSRRQMLQRNGSGSSGSTTIASHSTSSTDSQNDEERPACWTDITSSLTRQHTHASTSSSSSGSSFSSSSSFDSQTELIPKPKQVHGKGR